MTGATAYESAAIAGMASSAIVASASGTALGWVASPPAENGDVLVRPATRDDISSVDVTESCRYAMSLDDAESSTD